MQETTHTIQLFIGSVRPLPNSGRPSAIFKHPVKSTIWLGTEGFKGDEQADRRVHGGPDKAVHLYPSAHYARLAAQFPTAAASLQIGSIGENIACATLTEKDVHLGDVFALGCARLQFSQPRNPCWKIDARYDQDGMAAYIAETGLTGWYLRVLEPGEVSPTDKLGLIERQANSPSLADAATLLRTHRPDSQLLRALTNWPGLATGWCQKIIDRANWLEQNAISA